MITCVSKKQTTSFECMQFAKICKESYNWFPSIQFEISLLNRFWSAIIFSEGTFVLAQLSLTPWIRSSTQIEKHPFFKEVEPEAPTQYFQRHELLLHDVNCKHIPVRCEFWCTMCESKYTYLHFYLIYCTLITHILHFNIAEISPFWLTLEWAYEFPPPRVE